MKKILSCVTLFFCLFLLGSVCVKAVSMRFEPSEVVKGKSTILYITDLESSANYKLEYSSGYENILGTSENYCRNMIGSCHIDFKKTIAPGEVTVSLIKIDTDKNDTVASAKVKVIGNTTSSSKSTTTKKSTTKATTTAKVLSNNANLSSLTIKDQDGAVMTYTPEFKADVYDYEVQAISDVKKIQIEATMEDAKANLVISENINDELVAGEVTKIVLTVTAEDGVSKKSYNVNVTKEALNGDSTLKKLLISELPNFKFSSNITRYEIDIDKKISKLSITCIPTSEKATCKVVGNENLKNGSEIKVVVTAEDVSNKKEYTIVVNKKSNEVKKIDMEDIKDPLIIMCLSITAFALIGGIFYTIKR